MATGDLKRSLRKLEQVLRSLNYPNEVDYVGLMKGDTAASLPIISYSLTSYSPHVAELLMESNIELIAKNDVRFTDTVYKNSSCQRKKSISEKPESCSSREKCPAETVGIGVTGRFMTSGKKKAVVIRHLYTEENVSVPEGTVTSTEVSEGCNELEEQSSDIRIPEAQAPEVKAELQDMCDNPEVTALQIALAECQEKLKKLTWIEKRLECLEATTKGKVMVDEKAWNNILSRVTLLETEMLLSKKNESVEPNTTSEDSESISGVDVVPYDKKYSVEGPASTCHSSGYSTVSLATVPRSSTINYCGLNDFSEETTMQKMERMKKMFEETAELLKCSSR
ncbi:centrosomal protein of 44 kDa isoform X3 [Rattus rattus]|uniref:centrosomal protein of 44 kDa isoform X3 n=1 Tax=Rattus rattus TaxID=10117 RepID=UPI0013F2D05F|nr:centrosomal protein of 44 kDa isoform X3 [Rattus rattus]